MSSKEWSSRDSAEQLREKSPAAPPATESTDEWAIVPREQSGSNANGKHAKEAGQGTEPGPDKGAESAPFPVSEADPKGTEPAKNGKRTLPGKAGSIAGGRIGRSRNATRKAVDRAVGLRQREFQDARKRIEQLEDKIGDDELQIALRRANERGERAETEAAEARAGAEEANQQAKAALSKAASAIKRSETLEVALGQVETARKLAAEAKVTADETASREGELRSQLERTTEFWSKLEPTIAATGEHLKIVEEKASEGFGVQREIRDQLGSVQERLAALEQAQAAPLDRIEKLEKAGRGHLKRTDQIEKDLTELPEMAAEIKRRFDRIDRRLTKMASAQKEVAAAQKEAGVERKQDEQRILALESAVAAAAAAAAASAAVEPTPEPDPAPEPDPPRPAAAAPPAETPAESALPQLTSPPELFDQAELDAAEDEGGADVIEISQKKPRRRRRRRKGSDVEPEAEEATEQQPEPKAQAEPEAELEEESEAEIEAEPEPEIEAKPAREAKPGRETKPGRSNGEARGLDLNAVGFDELRGLGLSVADSTRLLAARDVRGGFEGVADLDSIQQLSGDAHHLLRASAGP